MWKVVRKGVGGAVSEVGRRLSQGGQRQEEEEQSQQQQQQQQYADGEGSSSSSSSSSSEKKTEIITTTLPSTSPSTPPAPITWASLGPRAQATLLHSLALRTRVAHHLEAHDLDRPKMNEWLALSLRAAAYIFFLRSVAEVWSRRESIHETAALTKKNTEEFLVYRFVDPGKAILDDLILNKRQRMTDVGAIADAQASLRRMLSDFIEDTYPRMSKEERKKALEAMDISLVSEQYDKEIRHAVRNVFSGKIVRMLLIQMQYVKKEVRACPPSLPPFFPSSLRINLPLIPITTHPSLSPSLPPSLPPPAPRGHGSHRRPLQRQQGQPPALRRHPRPLSYLLLLPYLPLPPRCTGLPAHQQHFRGACLPPSHPP